MFKNKNQIVEYLWSDMLKKCEYFLIKSWKNLGLRQTVEKIKAFPLFLQSSFSQTLNRNYSLLIYNNSTLSTRPIITTIFINKRGQK
jgi:hypothetical protein